MAVETNAFPSSMPLEYYASCVAIEVSENSKRLDHTLLLMRDWAEFLYVVYVLKGAQIVKLLIGMLSFFIEYSAN